MKILAIETSCDDTGIAMLEAKGPTFNVLANTVASQIEIHKKYGGVFPMMAKREHQKNLVPVLTKTLREATLLKAQRPKLKTQSHNLRLKTIENILLREADLFQALQAFLGQYEKPDIDLIAVTHGPGLEPCLWAGINFAKALSYSWGIPIVPVNHIEAHILVNFIDLSSRRKAQRSKPQSKAQNLFPAICLVASGGHTQLILMKNIGDYEIIGETRDDAAGECFDKTAKILGLEYPGGPIIAKIATSVQGPTSYTLPRPMIHSKDFDFSFSGLKTAVLYATRGKKLTKRYVREMCYEIQQAIVEVLIKKTMDAAKRYRPKTIIVGGGVSANQALRKQLGEAVSKAMPSTAVIIPEQHLSTDNALMIAVAGYFHQTKKTEWQKVNANANLRIH